jgi:hypothetical protein
MYDRTYTPAELNFFEPFNTGICYTKVLVFVLARILIGARWTDDFDDNCRPAKEFKLYPISVTDRLSQR